MLGDFVAFNPPKEGVVTGAMSSPPRSWNPIAPCFTGRRELVANVLILSGVGAETGS
jgi:hypothetical protein